MNDVVITTLLTATPDPIRGERWPADANLVAELAASCRRHDRPLVVLHDCLDDVLVGRINTTVRWVRVEPDGNPYLRRWEVIAEHIAGARYDRVWCVDGTDVEMLHGPFPHMQPHHVYCGSEDEVVGCAWMRDNHTHWVIEKQSNDQLLNAGLLGGDWSDVWWIASAVAQCGWPGDKTDMAAFNFVLGGFWRRSRPLLVTGPMVHTVHRAFDRTASSWWRHK